MLTIRPARAAAAAALAVVALAGCGGANEHATNAPAQPYSKRSTVPDTVARVTPAGYRQPIATYKRYVRRRLRRCSGTWPPCARRSSVTTSRAPGRPG
jgi:hypothetical protein